MAFNDAVLETQDWESLRSMHDSSKTADESSVKIGFSLLGYLWVSGKSGNMALDFDPSST